MALIDAFGLNSGKLKKVGSSDTLDIEGSVKVDGDLVVSGATISASNEEVLVASNALVLNSGGATTAVNGYLVSVVEGDSSPATVTHSQTNADSRPQLTISSFDNSGDPTFSANDFVMWENASLPEDSGLYVVQSAANSAGITSIVLAKASDINAGWEFISTAVQNTTNSAISSAGNLRLIKKIAVIQMHSGGEAKHLTAEDASSAPGFNKILHEASSAADFPTLNQNTTGSSASATGNAGSATRLANARTFLVDLTETDASTAFDGQADVTDIGVTGALAVGNGGTGASSLTDGGILLGSGTGAVTAMAVLTDGAIVVGDGSTDPVSLSAFSSSTGTLKVANGGTGLAAPSGGDAGKVLTVNTAEDGYELQSPGSSSTVTTTEAQVVNSAFDGQEQINEGLVVAFGDFDNTVKKADKDTAATDAPIGLCASDHSGPTLCISVTSADRVPNAQASRSIKIGNGTNANIPQNGDGFTLELQSAASGNPTIQLIVNFTNSGGTSTQFGSDGSNNNKLVASIDITHSSSNDIQKVRDAIKALFTDLIGNARNDNGGTGHQISSYGVTDSNGAGSGGDQQKIVTLTATANGSAFNINFLNETDAGNVIDGDTQVAGTTQSGASLNIQIVNSDAGKFADLYNLDFTVKHDGSTSKQYRIKFASGNTLSNSETSFTTADGKERAQIFVNDATNNDAATRTNIINAIKAALDGESELAGGSDWNSALATTSSSNDTVVLTAADATNADFDFSAVSTNHNFNEKISIVMPGSVAEIASGSVSGAPSRGAELYLGNNGQITVDAPTSGCIYRVGYATASTAQGGKYKVLFQPQYIADL